MPDLVLSALQTPGLTWLVLTIIVAGLVRGFAGFGSAMIIMPMASSVLSPVAAIVFLSVVELTGPLPNLPAALRDGNRPDIARLALGAVLALPFGIYSLTLMSPEFFGWIVSILVLALLAALITGWRYRGELTKGLIIATGGVGGFLSGSTGVAGPPVIMLYMASLRPISVIRANFPMYLLMIDLLMLAAFSMLGMMELAPAIIGVLLWGPYMLANVIGARFFRPDAERSFRAVAYIIIAASAILGLPLWS